MTNPDEIAEAGLSTADEDGKTRPNKDIDEWHGRGRMIAPKASEPMLAEEQPTMGAEDPHRWTKRVGNKDHAIMDRWGTPEEGSDIAQGNPKKSAHPLTKTWRRLS